MLAGMEAPEHVRGRRALRAFRVAFYPLALGAAVLLLLHARHDGGTRQANAVLSGRTAQGESIALELDGSKPLGLLTMLHTRCPSGERRDVGWSPWDGNPVPFERDGGRLRVRETADRSYADGQTGHTVVTLDASVAAERASGTMRAIESFARGGVPTVTCDSGPIRFTAGHRRRLAQD